MASSSFAILPLLNYNSTTNRSSSSYSSPIRFWNLPRSKHRSAKHSNPRSPQVLVSFSLNQPADEESSDAALFLESNSIADYMRFKRRSDADDGNNNNGSSELQTAIVSYKKRFPWILLNPFLQVKPLLLAVSFPHKKSEQSNITFRCVAGRFGLDDSYCR